MIQTSVMKLRSATWPCPFQGVEAFPTSPSAIHAVGLERRLDRNAVAKLREIERQLRDTVRMAPILQARTEQGLEKALAEAFEAAADYYVESGTIIWRALNHDYAQLLELSRASCQALETEFLEHAKRLQRETLIRLIAGVRVWRKVGEWVITAENDKELAERQPPISYLFDALAATFLASCVLSYVKGEVKRARARNLQAIAEAIWDSSEKAYRDAVEQKLHEIAGDEQYWYWSPQWQEGEADADLDRKLGNVERFASAEDLLRDLKSQGLGA